MSDRILIVEDNELNLRLFSDLLRGEGFEVHVARNGDEALAQAIQVEPALILMDVQLPAMSGIETARKIRGQSSRAPSIIAVSAFPRRRDCGGSAEDFCDDYMVKPVLPSTLIATVRRHLPSAGASAGLSQDRQRMPRCPAEF